MELPLSTGSEMIIIHGHRGSDLTIHGEPYVQIPSIATRMVLTRFFRMGSVAQSTASTWDLNPVKLAVVSGFNLIEAKVEPYVVSLR